MNLPGVRLAVIIYNNDTYHFKLTYMDYIGLSSGWLEILLFSITGLMVGTGVFFSTTFLLRRYSDVSNPEISRYAISFTVILKPLILILMIFGLLYLIYKYRT